MPEPQPLDVGELLAPTVDDALATAGTLIHWVTSDPELVTRFARWVEHCPGDLDDGLMLGVLAATHDVLCPGCPDAVVLPGHPGTPGTPEGRDGHDS